jgi:hypothetical protein
MKKLLYPSIIIPALGTIIVLCCDTGAAVTAFICTLFLSFAIYLQES